MSIYLVGPDGRKYTLDSENPADLNEVLRQGYKQQLADSSSTSDKVFDAVGAGVSGALSGVSGGLSDAVIADKSPELAHEMERVKQAHPFVHGATNLAGMMVSPLNEVVKPIEAGIGATTVLGRTAARGVSNAAAGSLFGAGNTLSDAALGDHDLTAEQLISGAGLGAVLGGAGGLFGSALEEGAAALPKLGRSTSGANDTLSTWAAERGLNAAGATKSDLNYLGIDKAKDLGRVMLDRGHLGTGLEAPNANGILENVQKDMAGVSKDYGHAIDSVDAGPNRPDYKGVVKAIEDWRASKSPLEQRAIASEVEAAKGAALKHGGFEMTNELPYPVQTSEPEGFRGLQKLKSDLQSQAKYSNNLADDFKGGLKRELAATVREQLDSQIVPHLNAINPEAGAKFLADKALLSKLYDAERIAEHGVKKLGGNAQFGLRDTILAAGAHDPVSGLIAGIASKVMRERGQAIIARLAHHIAGNPSLSPIAASFGQRLQSVAPMLGEYSQPLTQALAQSSANALATHMTLAKVDPNYAQAAELAGFNPEVPGQHDHALKKAHDLSSIEASVQTQNAKLDRHIDSVFRGERAPMPSSTSNSQDFGTKRMRREAEDGHAQQLKDIHALATDPQSLVDRITANTGPLADVAPGVAAAVSRTASNAVQYLASQSQHPPKAGPLAPDWTPSEAERHEFASKLEAVQDPTSTLRHAAARTLTQDQVQAVATVYPGWYRDTCDKMLSKAMTSKMSYQSRLMVSRFTGVDLDGSISSLPQTQAAIAMAKKSVNQTQGELSSNQSQGDSKLSLAQRTAPESQRTDHGQA